MKIALVAITLFIAATAQAAQTNDDILTQLRKCKTIANNLERLACFDTLAAPASQLTVLEGKKRELAVKNKTPLKAPSSAPKATAGVITGEEAFGKTEAEINSLETLKSSIQGEFKGWVKGATITLQNGQKWKVLSRSTGYTNLTNPEVEISRGIFGSFNMKVNGLNASAKVRRID